MAKPLHHFLAALNFVTVVLTVTKGRVLKGELMPKRHYCLAQFFRLLRSFFHMYLLTPVLKRVACDAREYTFQ